MKNKLINKIGKVLASIAVGAGSLISPVTSIAVSAASSEQAMQAKADTLVGNTEIDCWAGSALILKAADLLFFADNYNTSYPDGLKLADDYAVAGDQSKVKLANGNTFQLQVGDVLAFFATQDAYDSDSPSHTMTYVGDTPSSESSAAKPYLNANVNNTTLYTNNTYYGSFAIAEVRRYSRTNSVNVPVTIKEQDPSNVLTLGSPSKNYMPTKNHVTGGKVSATVADIKAALPAAEFNNADFSGTASGSRVQITLTASTAYFDENSSSRKYSNITSVGTLYHGRESESAFADKIAGQLSYMLTNLPNDVKTVTGSDKFANENVRVQSVEIKYIAVPGGDSSSDQQRKINYYVDGNLDNTEMRDVNTKVTYTPDEPADKVFDGWYRDTGMTNFFNGVVPAIAPGEEKVDGYYVLNLYGAMKDVSGAKTNLNITASDTTENGTPLAGVKIQVSDNKGNVIATGTTGSDGKFVAESGTVTGLKPGIYTVTETELPSAGQGYTYGTGLKTETVNTTSIDEDTTVDVPFEHKKTKVAEITFVAIEDGSDPDDYTLPTSGYPTQTTTAGGYVTKPMPNPTRKGYSFDGWFDENETEFDFDRELGTSGELEDFTLYAHWTEVPTKTVHVTFVDDISNDASIKSQWTGTDLSGYNFDVLVTKGLPSAVENEEHETLGQIIDTLLGLNYVKKDPTEKFPTVIEYTKDETGADVEPSDIEVHLIHGTNEDSEESTTVDVIRTIEFHYDTETGRQAHEDVVQTGVKQKTGKSTVTDLVVTDNTPIVTEGSKSVKYGWSSYTVPEIDGYTPDKATIPAVSSVSYDDFVDETVKVVYTEIPGPADVVVTITGKTETVTYDGTEHTVTGYTFSADNPDYLESYFHVTEQKSAVRTNAGTTALGLTKELFVNDSPDYNVTFVVTDGSLTIDPKQVIVTAANAQKVQGDVDPTLTASVTGTIGSDTVDYSVYRAKGETVGTYKIFTAGAKSQDNYQITFMSGTFTIKAKEKPTPEPTETPDIPTPEPTEEGYTGWHTDIDDAQQTVTFPGIRTTASDTSDTATDPDKDNYYYITDVVEFVGLTPQTVYKMTGTLMDKATGEVVEGVAPLTRTFTPKTSDGTMTMVFKVEKALLRNKKVVVFEACYEDTTEIAVHADIDDEGQTVEFIEPELKTTAVDTNTKLKTIVINDKAQTKTVYLTDTVSYSGLKPNKSYIMTGTIHKRTGTDTDAGALTITGTTVSKTFTPSEPNGTVDVLFEFDGSTLVNGDVLVVFETLTQNGEEVGKHEDITDEDQTVTVEKRAGNIRIGTTATGDSGTKNVEVSKTAVITDVVTYENAMPNYEYTLKGELHKVEDDGTTKTDGGKIKDATMTFTSSETGNGTVTMTFSDVDIADLEGKDLVVFEYLYDAAAGTEPVASHNNINDDGQTVHVVGKVPGIGTTATGDNGSKIVKPKAEAKVTDTIAYNKLIAGVEYTMKGELHLVNTDGSDGGVKAEAVKTFTPTAESGTVSIDFSVDASELEGKSLVVFEYLYKGSTAEGEPIATHADLTDKGQTVDVRKEQPTIATTATNENNGKTVKAGTSVKVIDTVTYKALDVGTEYTMKGTLHLVGTDGKDEKTLATETVKFTPTSENGTVKMTFTVDTSSLKGRSLVVFEELLKGEVTIATHADINDKGQTVTVEEDTPPTPEPSVPHIHTLAYNATDGYDTVYPRKSVTINDIVYFDGLTPYVEYTLEGTLHVKKADGTDGGILYDTNGNPVTASKTFIPTVSTGATELSFTFDASGLNGHVCVAYEQLYLTKDHVFVQSHEDITDDDETMWIERNPKRRRLRIRWIRTGVGRNVMIYGGIGLVAAIGLAIVIALRKKASKTRK